MDVNIIGGEIGMIWVNQSEFKFDDGAAVSGLATPFPFNRVASLYVNTTEGTYIYHQLNDTVIAEDFQDGAFGSWFPSNITVPT